MNLLLHILAFLAGALMVAGSLLSAIRTIVLPRSAPDKLARLVFVSIRILFRLRLQVTRSYLERDSVMALYTPISLLVLLATWMVLTVIAYTLVFWGIGVGSWLDLFHLSVSSLVTLGFVDGRQFLVLVLIFSEAMIGLILIALLIAYLPTMYAAFSRRELAHRPLPRSYSPATAA